MYEKLIGQNVVYNKSVQIERGGKTYQISKGDIGRIVHVFKDKYDGTALRICFIQSMSNIELAYLPCIQYKRLCKPCVSLALDLYDHRDTFFSFTERSVLNEYISLSKRRIRLRKK